MEREILINIRVFLALILLPFLSYPQANTKARTIVTPYLNAEIKKDTNLIYCSTFQIAWNKFKKEAGGDIILSGKTELADSLNNGEDAEKYVSKKDYMATAGVITDRFIKTLNKKLQRKYGDVFPPTDEKADTESYLILAYLYKKLNFRSHFQKHYGLYFNEGNKKVNVKAFGIFPRERFSLKQWKMLKQIEIYYQSDDEFIIKLKPKKKKDEIILAMIPPSRTLKESMDKINESLKTFKKIRPDKKIELAIPELNFNDTVIYYQLIGKSILNERFKSYFISDARQYIYFTLNEKGVILKSVAKIKLTRGVGSIRPSYKFIFNKPFFIVLKEKGKEYPYFIARIENTSLMKKK